MNDDDLNRILSREKDIVPSSGFASSIMEKIHLEVTAPPPIPFPWMRVLPGIVMCVALAVIFPVYFLHVYSAAAIGWNSIPSSAFFQVPDWWASLRQTAIQWQAGWALLALAVSFVAWKLSMMLAAWRE